MKMYKSLALSLILASVECAIAAIYITPIADIDNNVIRAIVNETQSATGDLRWNQLIDKITAVYHGNSTQTAMVNKINKKQVLRTKQNIVGVANTKSVYDLRDEIVANFRDIDTEEITSKISEAFQIIKKSQDPRENKIDPALYEYIGITIYYYAFNLLNALNVIQEENLDQADQSIFTSYMQDMNNILEVYNNQDDIQIFKMPKKDTIALISIERNISMPEVPSNILIPIRDWDTNNIAAKNSSVGPELISAIADRYYINATNAMETIAREYSSRSHSLGPSMALARIRSEVDAIKNKFNNIPYDATYNSKLPATPLINELQLYNEKSHDQTISSADRDRYALLMDTIFYYAYNTLKVLKQVIKDNRTKDRISYYMVISYMQQLHFILQAYKSIKSNK